MKPRALLIALLSLPLAAQTVIIGAVEKIDKDQLQVKSQDGIVTLHVDERTTVRKGKTLNDLSALATGDEVRATCYGEGTMTAANISARVTFSGIITESSPAHIKVIPDSANGKKAAMFVFLDHGAKIAMSPRRLVVGQRVHVVGWDSGDDVVDADRVAIYDTDLPLRPPAKSFR